MLAGENPGERLAELKEKHAGRGSAADVAYWAIRDAVRNRIIRSGEALVEVTLANALSMSRTPIREALRRLELERLIVNLPRRGLVVPNITLGDLVEIFEIREVLEALATRRAAMGMGPAEIEALRATLLESEEAAETEDLHALSVSSYRFHSLIRAGSKNSRLPDLIHLLEDSHRSWWMTQFAPERAAAAVLEHRGIFEAIAAGESDEAERLAKDHVRKALQAQIMAHRQDDDG